MLINYLLFTLFILLLIHYLVFLKEILKGLNKLNSYSDNSLREEFVSIIIPFRNESENILRCLQSIEEQEYPKEKFDVIFVDDSSEDDSLSKLKSAEKSNNVKIISVSSNLSNVSADQNKAHKKFAIRLGIEESEGDIIVATDADCIHEKKWLKTLINSFDDQTGFVSGPVEFLDEVGIFNKIQKIEFAGLVLSGAGLIGINKPVICNAANVAYRKAAYLQVNGFENQLHLSSGDDEILMQRIFKRTKFKIIFCANKNAVVKTSPNKRLFDFYQQRKRWASKSLFYNDKLLTIKLILIFLFYLSFIVQIFLSFILFPLFIFSFILSIIFKMIFEYRILKKGEKLFSYQNFLKYFFITELIHVPYIIIASISGVLGNFQWKERKVKR